MRSPPAMCHPTTLALRSQVSQLRPHSPSSCQGRRRSRGSGERSSCEQSAHSTPPPPPALLITPHPSRILTELPLGLAHGPRTPGPLEETVVGPGSQPGGTLPPSTHSLTPTLPQVPSEQQLLATQIPGRPSNPKPVMAHWSLSLSFPTQQRSQHCQGLLCRVCLGTPQPVKWGAARLGSLLGVPEGLTCSWRASPGQQESWVGAACRLRSSVKAKGPVSAGLAGQPLKLPSPGRPLPGAQCWPCPGEASPSAWGPCSNALGAEGRVGSGLAHFPTRTCAVMWGESWFWGPDWLVGGQQLERPYSP